MTAPVPRIALWGRLRIGVSNNAPRLPVLVMVKVPPVRASAVMRPAADSCGDLRNRGGHSRDGHVLGVAQNRHDKAFGTVDGNPQVYRVVIRDLGGIVVDRRVQQGVFVQRLHGGFDEERQTRQFRPGPVFEVILLGGTQACDAGDVGLNNRRQLRCGVQRFEHASRDRLTDLREAFNPAGLS